MRRLMILLLLVALAATLCACQQPGAEPAELAGQVQPSDLIIEPISPSPLPEATSPPLQLDIPVELLPAVPARPFDGEGLLTAMWDPMIIDPLDLEGNWGSGAMDPARFLDAFSPEQRYPLTDLIEVIKAVGWNIHQADVERLEAFLLEQSGNEIDGMRRTHFVMSRNETPLWLDGRERQLMTLRFTFTDPAGAYSDDQWGDNALEYYFLETGEGWKNPARLWRTRWQDYTEATEIVLAEDGSAAWLMVNPVHGTGTGFFNGDVVFVNLLSGKADLAYIVHQFNFPTSEFGEILGSVLYGMEQRAMPNGQTYWTLPGRFFLRIGFAQYGDPDAFDQDSAAPPDFQAQHTYEYRISGNGGYPRIVEAGHTLDIPLDHMDNVACRNADSIVGEGVFHESPSEWSIE